MTADPNDYVTVAVVARNEASHIGATLSWLSRQSYPHDCYEILLIDGDSSDATRDLAREAVSQCAVPVRIVNERDYYDANGGPSYGHSWARNLAVALADPRSAFIAWTDGDCRVPLDWLEVLWRSLKDAPGHVAAAGGPRLIEGGEAISSRELVLNTYLGSYVMTLGNPAFCVREARFARSVAGYSSIYRRAVLERYPYDSSFPFFTDDSEINARLARVGYRFLNVPRAGVYHRLEDDPVQFLKRFFNYGRGAARVARLHRSPPRAYVAVALAWSTYVAAAPVLLRGRRAKSLWAAPALVAVGVALSAAVEVTARSRRYHGAFVAPIALLHPIAYGAGFLVALFERPAVALSKRTPPLVSARLHGASP